MALVSAGIPKTVSSSALPLWDNSEHSETLQYGSLK